MDVGSAKVVAKVPKRLRSPEIIEAAKLEPRETVKFVQERHPELRIETQVPRQYAFTASQTVTVDGAVQLAKMMFDLSSDEDAIESLAAEFIQSHQDIYQKIQAGEIVV